MRRLTHEEILAKVPQQRPFRFIDRIISVDEQRIVGEYTYRPDESFYEGHFPGDPVTPGVILLETICQIGLVAFGIYLLALEASEEEVASNVTLFSDAQIEFEKMVRPGETVRVESERLVWRRKKLKTQATLFLADGTVVARGTIAGMGVNRRPGGDE